MGFYSFVVVNESRNVVTLQDYFLVLDAGQNVFNAQVTDIEKFSETLKAEGVRIDQMHRLDEFQKIEPSNPPDDPPKLTE